MDKQQAEQLKADILSRRSYLQGTNIVFPTNKRGLFSGMGGRLSRRSCAKYVEVIKAQKSEYENRLSKVDKYLKYLDDKSTAEAEGSITILDAPTTPNMIMNPRPIRLAVRKFPRGIHGRGR